MFTRATRCGRPPSDPRMNDDSTRYSRPCQTGGRNAKCDGAAKARWSVRGDRDRLRRGLQRRLPLPVAGARSAAPTLIVKNGPLAGERLRVIAPLTLGREDVDVLMDAPMVSRRHAVVRPVDGGLEIDDLGSTNGTWVNGERIEAATL